MVCRCIPHTWRTVGSHSNKFYINSKTEYLHGSETPYSWGTYVSILPEGNYTGSNLATSIHELLNGLPDTFTFDVIYHPTRGIISIEGKSEGVSSNNKFLVPSGPGIMNWMINTESRLPWGDIDGNVQTVDIHNLRSINIVRIKKYRYDTSSSIIRLLPIL